MNFSIPLIYLSNSLKLFDCIRKRITRIMDILRSKNFKIVSIILKFDTKHIHRETSLLTWSWVNWSFASTFDDDEFYQWVFGETIYYSMMKGSLDQIRSGNFVVELLSSKLLLHKTNKELEPQRSFRSEFSLIKQ